MPFHHRKSAQIPSGVSRVFLKDIPQKPFPSALFIRHEGKKGTPELNCSIDGPHLAVEALQTVLHDPQGGGFVPSLHKQGHDTRRASNSKVREHLLLRSIKGVTLQLNVQLCLQDVAGKQDSLQRLKNQFLSRFIRLLSTPSMIFNQGRGCSQCKNAFRSREHILHY